MPEFFEHLMISCKIVIVKLASAFANRLWAQSPGIVNLTVTKGLWGYVNGTEVLREDPNKEA